MADQIQDPDGQADLDSPWRSGGLRADTPGRKFFFLYIGVFLVGMFHLLYPTYFRLDSVFNSFKNIGMEEIGVIAGGSLLIAAFLLVLIAGVAMLNLMHSLGKGIDRYLGYHQEIDLEQLRQDVNEIQEQLALEEGEDPDG